MGQHEEPLEAQQSLAIFESYRAFLFAIAYRMLGSVMDAEDMVQETYLRYQRDAARDDHRAKSLPDDYPDAALRGPVASGAAHA